MMDGTNSTALGDKEHKGEDVSLGSPTGLAMAGLLHWFPVSRITFRSNDLRVRRGWVCAAALWVLDAPLEREQSCGVRLRPSWSLTCQRVQVQGFESFQGSPMSYQRQQRGLFHHPA